MLRSWRTKRCFLLKFLIDESVSLAVTQRLRELGHQVEAISEGELASLSDSNVFEMAIKTKSILITRDWDFTNRLLFPPEKAEGMIYIRHGNLQSEEEADIVENIIRQYSADKLKGRLLAIYKNFASIR